MESRTQGLGDRERSYRHPFDKHYEDRESSADFWVAFIKIPELTRVGREETEKFFPFNSKMTIASIRW